MCLDIPRGAHILAFLNIIFLKLFHRGKSEVNLKQLCSSPPHKDSPQPLKWTATLKQPEKQRKWSRWLSVIWWSFGCFSLLKMYLKIDGSLYVSFLIRDFKDLNRYFYSLPVKIMLSFIFITLCTIWQTWEVTNICVKEIGGVTKKSTSTVNFSPLPIFIVLEKQK